MGAEVAMEEEKKKRGRGKGTKELKLRWKQEPKPKGDKKPVVSARGDRFQLSNVMSAVFRSLWLQLIMMVAQTGMTQSFRDLYGWEENAVSGMTHPSKYLTNPITTGFIETYKFLFEKYGQAYAQIDAYVKPFLKECLADISNAVVVDNLGDWCRQRMVEYLTMILQGYLQMFFRGICTGNQAFSFMGTEDQMAEVKKLPSIQAFMNSKGAKTTGKSSPDAMFKLVAARGVLSKKFLDELPEKIPVPQLIKLAKDAMIPGHFTTTISKEPKPDKGERSSAASSNGESSKAAAMDVDVQPDEVERLLIDLVECVGNGLPEEELETTLKLFPAAVGVGVRASLKDRFYMYKGVKYEFFLRELNLRAVIIFYAYYYGKLQDPATRGQALVDFVGYLYISDKTRGWKTMKDSLLAPDGEGKFQLDGTPEFKTFMELIQHVLTTEKLLLEVVQRLGDEPLTAADYERVNETVLYVVALQFPMVKNPPLSHVETALMRNGPCVVEGTRYEQLWKDFKDKQREKEAARPAFQLRDQEVDLDTAWLQQLGEDLDNDPDPEVQEMLRALRNPEHLVAGTTHVVTHAPSVAPAFAPAAPPAAASDAPTPMDVVLP